MALANRPRLLLADEPTGELDTATARIVLETFRRLNESLGITTVIVSHDRDIARFVDRVVAIRDGKTSTERVRRSAAPSVSADAAAPTEGDYHEYVVLDSAGRLQIPSEYREKLDIGDRVTVDIVEGGLVVRPVAGRGLVAKEERGGEAADHRRRQRPRRSLFPWRRKRE